MYALLGTSSQISVDWQNHKLCRSVSRDSLKALAGLARLDLRGNQLATLFPEVLRPLASLRELDFSGNHFESLPLLELEHVEGTLESVKFEGRTQKKDYFSTYFFPHLFNCLDLDHNFTHEAKRIE